MIPTMRRLSTAHAEQRGYLHAPRGWAPYRGRWALQLNHLVTGLAAYPKLADAIASIVIAGVSTAGDVLEVSPIRHSRRDPRRPG